jgi:thiosulfate dehydrogenase [quinone] large subunit
MCGENRPRAAPATEEGRSGMGHAKRSKSGGGLAGPAGLEGLSGPVGSRPLRESASRYALLPLRLFLGATFVYAGIDKLTDPAFLAASGTGSVGDLMRSIRDQAAIPAMVDLALRNPEGFGYAIAVGELAVGVGTLVGLLSRLAAIGGVLISLSLWLTVSWQTHPYYYGNDLIYMVAWIPMVVAGAPQLSLDALWSRRGRSSAYVSSAQPVLH